MKKIYYWVNDIEKNSGEGILANNFLKLIKIKFKNHKYININNFSKKNNLLYNYLSPFCGVILIWTYHLQGKKVSYINYLPILNFLLFLLLPKETILGTITGTNTKKNILYLVLKNIGILITDHDVQATLAITDKTYLMYNGGILKEGTPEELAADQMVRKVYLGKDFELKKKKTF